MTSVPQESTIPPPICPTCVPQCPGTYVVARDRWVKIGRSTNVAARLLGLRNKGGVLVPVQMDVHQPLVPLMVFGEPRLEKHLHRAFFAYRETGEWFRPDVLDFIDKMVERDQVDAPIWRAA